MDGKTFFTMNHDYDDDYVQVLDIDDWDKNKDDDLNIIMDFDGDVIGKYNVLAIGEDMIGNSELFVNYVGSIFQGGSVNDVVKLNGQTVIYYIGWVGNFLYWVDDNGIDLDVYWTYVKILVADVSIFDIYIDCVGNNGCQLSDWV